jgi:hypothetical protein
MLLTLTGCFLRPAVMPVSPEYRSQEAYGGAHWGMTEEELIGVAPDLARCGDGLFCREERLKERPAQVTYELSRGRLSRVRLKVESTDPKADLERFRQELTEEYGPRAQLGSARLRVGPYAVVALMDAVGGVYKPILGPLAPNDEGWTTPETEMRLVAPELPNHWLELTLSSRLLARAQFNVEAP